MDIKARCPAGLRLSRDEHGVPHIHAEDLRLAHWGMGYCHALDRGMQIGLMRLLGQGRTAECLADSDAAVESDLFFRRMNWRGRQADELSALSPRTTDMLSMYCAGVNAGLSRARPWEFRMLGYRPTPWTPEDCLLLARMTGYLTLAQSQAEVERLFVELVQAGVDDEKLQALFPNGFETLDRELLCKIRLGERIVPESLKWASPAPRLMASNNWVVAASHSRTGHALFANDPHLEVNRLPNVWVEQVIEFPDDTICTANMPGLPGALIGRKENLAWGATYAFMDGVDSWVEECRDGKRRVGEAWEDFEARHERILRKKGDPIDAVFYENQHGVLDGDPQVAGFYLATRWAPADGGARTLEAAVAMWDAQSVEEGMEALSGIETAWNYVFADAKGRIGYQMSGRLPIRHPEASGFVPMPGWDPAFDWKGWAAPHDLPRSVDPPEGFIVTANQDLNAWGKLRPINMPMGDYRARRIAELLAESPCDLDTFARIHMDVHSIQAREMVEKLRPLLPDTASAALLLDWDCNYDPDSKGAALFEAFYEELVVEILGNAGFGEDVVRHLIDATGIFIDFYQNFDRLLTQESPWLADRSLESAYRDAFDRAAARPPSRWGDQNRVTLIHILFGGRLPKILGFNYGPLELRGGRATPHQGQVYESGGRSTSFAPSLRMMADLGESTLHTSMAGGPSDRRFSRWYRSGINDWLAGRYKTLGRGPLSLESP